MGSPAWLVREPALARLLGVSGRTVRDLVAKEVFSKGPDGQYDLEVVLPAYCAHLREMAAGRSGAGLTDERARIAKERADQLAMQNEATRGQLVPVDQVGARWVEIAGEVRVRLMTVPSRCRSRLPHLTPFDVETLDREIRDALTELSRDDPPEAG